MQIDRERYKVYDKHNWMMKHHMINPGLAFNELILGQRVPKVSLEDKKSEKPRIERSYVPCPHCEKLHDARIWSPQNGTAFKNYFGLYCPDCGKVIPCLTNYTTRALLFLFKPILGKQLKKMKQIWLAKQPARYEDVDVNKVGNPRKNWWKTGLAWGGIMFVLMSLIYPLIIGQEITPLSLGIGAVIWSMGGLVFGLFMKNFASKKGSKTFSS